MDDFFKSSNITFLSGLSDWKFLCKHLGQDQTHKWGSIWTNIIVREIQGSDGRIPTPDKIWTRIELIDNLNNIIEIINFSSVMEPWTSPWIKKRHPHTKPFQSLWLGPTALCLLRQIMFTKIIACLDLSFGQWYIFISKSFLKLVFLRRMTIVWRIGKTCLPTQKQHISG